MGTIRLVKELTDNHHLIEFAEFMVPQYADGKLPDIKLTDLLDIHRLVPNLTMLDFEKEQGKVWIKFSGTKCDEFYGRNISDTWLRDSNQEGDSLEEIEHILLQGVEKKRPVYTRRPVHLISHGVERYSVIETLTFPSSRDGETVDHAISIVDFYQVTAATQKCLMVVE